METIPIDYDFETLVPGDENVLAISGALKVIAEPGERYNPLYIYGPPSVGKTHLIQALLKRFEQERPKWNILALPASEFIEECDHAWQTNMTPEFRQNLWQLDVLMIDDVHLLAKRLAALDELYHTFNRLVADCRQLVFSSRFAPAEMSEFLPALRYRFQSGLVIGIDPPRENMMRDIIMRRCQLTGIEPTQRATNFLCREVHSVRELHGVFHQLEQVHNGNSRQISLNQIRELVEKNAAEQITIADIATVVSEYFHVNLTKICSSSRQQPLVQARQMAMHIARELTSAPLAEIGRYFGGRDHTTVLYACRKVNKELSQNSFMARAARDIQTILRSYNTYEMGISR